MRGKRKITTDTKKEYQSEGIFNRHNITEIDRIYSPAQPKKEDCYNNNCGRGNASIHRTHTQRERAPLLLQSTDNRYPASMMK